MVELNNLLVPALAAAAEENIEVTTVVREVQARLKVGQISFDTKKLIHCIVRDSKISKQPYQNKDGLRGG